MEDKQIRSALIEKYLQAESTPAEEQMLRDWFTRHEPDEDERELALLIGLAAPCASYLPELDETEAAFDRIMATGDSSVKRGGRRIRWAAAIAAAAAIALFLLLRPHDRSETQLSPIVIAESIQQLMLLSPDQIETVVAKPEGSRAILTVFLKDGSTSAYILTCNEQSGSISLVAQN